MKKSTTNIHLGLHEVDPQFGSVVPPIYSTSTYIFPNAKEGAKRFLGQSKGMIYSRFTNPTVSLLEKRLAKLEDGEIAIAVSSGMAAIFTTLFGLLQPGDEIVAHRVLYGGTMELLSRTLPRYQIKTVFVDFKQPNQIEKAISKKTKILYFETPTNPLLEIIDIVAVSSIAKKHRIISIIDNTFAPPPLQSPIKLGVDLVIHSLTKYLNGHSDVIGGAVIGSKKLLDPIFQKIFIFLGPTMSPFSAYLILRGLTTLEVRLKKQCDNTMAIAQFLEKHPKVKKVYYPGLSSHPQHQTAKKQMTGYGGVLSFEVKGGLKAGEKLVNSVKIIHLAVSLGAVESLIEHPASMTHSEMSQEEKEKGGITDGLIRLSVGLEDKEDLINDIKQALDKI
jgi:methionine-gamma-lyase